MRLRSLLALLGAAVWLFASPAYASPPKESSGDKGGAEKGAPPAPDRVHDGSKGARIDGVYFTIAPLIVTVFHNDGGVGRISAVFTLEMASEELASSLAARHAKLHNALVRELHRLSEREERIGREFTIAQIKSRVSALITKRLGEGTVKDVLVQALNRS